MFLSNNNLEQESKFQYLGSIIRKDGRCKDGLKADRNGKNILLENEMATVQQINLHSIKEKLYRNIHKVHSHVWM